jgi:hypothetical protein
VRRMEFQQSRERIFRARMRSQNLYRTQKQRELQEFKKEKEERKMIIKQMKNP